MDLTRFVQLCVHGVSLGGVYGLVAVGYTIIYGVVGLINQAHGVFVTLAAFTAGWAVSVYGVPLGIALALGVLITGATALIVERIGYRPLRDHRLSAFTATVGVALVVQNALILLFSAMTRPFPRPGFLEGNLYLGEVRLPIVSLFVMTVCVVLFILLYYLITRTKIGTAMRALSKDMLATELMGVDVNKVISFAFALSSLYAAAGAYMWGFRFPGFSPYVGDMPALKGFVGAVIGGIGSIPGALLGAFIIGVMEVMLVGLFPTVTGWRDVRYCQMLWIEV